MAKGLFTMGHAIPMSELRKSPGKYFDSVIRDRPITITRHHDSIVALAESHLKELVRLATFTLNIDQEDGIYAVDIPELDLVAWGEDLEKVKNDLAEEAFQYAQEYMERFVLFFNSPNRRKHFPYVSRILLCKNIDEVKELYNA